MTEVTKVAAEVIDLDLRKKDVDLSSLKKGDTVDMAEMNIVIGVPEDAASVEIIARVPDSSGENLVKISKTLNVKDLSEAYREYIRLGEEGFSYVLTDEGRDYIDSLFQEEEKTEVKG